MLLVAYNAVLKLHLFSLSFYALPLIGKTVSHPYKQHLSHNNKPTRHCSV